MDAENNQCNFFEAVQPIDIIELQQTFYQLFGFGSHLIYDCYPSKVFVKMKIEVLCPGLNKTNQDRLIDMIWMQRSHRGNNQLFMSPIFICVVHDSDIKDNRLTYPLNIKSKRYTVHPVFRIQKCSGVTSVDDNGQNKCCAIFVDELGRVYQNWDDFQRNCKYADGLVVAPKLGIYNGSPTTNQVLLDIMQRSNGVTMIFDNGSMAIGLASAIVTGVALIPAVTVAPAVLTVAIGAAVTSAVYTGARSAFRLFDRKKHQQNIGLTDREARNEWFNISVGVVSIGAVGATQVVARAVRNGRNISTLARNSVRVVNIAAISVNAGACADQSYSFIYTLCIDGVFSKQQAAQLLINLFLLRHSVNNFSEFNRIMSDSNDLTSAALCESQTKSFQKLITQTKKMCGSAMAAVSNPIIRTIRLDLFQTIFKNIQNAGDSFEDGIKAVWATISPQILREYCTEFDKLFNKMIKMLLLKLNIELNSIIKLLIKLLRDVSLKAFRKLLEFLIDFFTEMAQSLSIKFEQFFKMYCIKLKQLAAIEDIDLNDYILTKPYDKLREAINGEKEKIERIDEIYDEAYGSDDACDLDENRKLELLINQYASEYTEEFLKCSPATNINELHEIIVQILEDLPHMQAQTFFAVAKQLITDHAQDIQKSLGRFISVEIFIVDIYRLLIDHSVRNYKYVSLSDYLMNAQFVGLICAMVQDEFIQFYTIKIDPSLKMVCCSACGGEVFVNK